jgi:hypothetical protein
MASRYSNTKILTKADTKKKYYESTIYPKIKPTDNDTYIISEQGDRLDILAKNYYGDSKLWWIIAVANNINDAVFYIEPGIQLRIPQNIGNVLRDLEKINK